MNDLLSATQAAWANRQTSSRKARAAARKLEAQKREASYAEAERIVATGKCPDCGNELIRNLALTGWWQCAGYASPGFRKPGHENDAKCGFQIFTRS